MSLSELLIGKRSKKSSKNLPLKTIKAWTFCPLTRYDNIAIEGKTPVNFIGNAPSMAVLPATLPQPKLIQLLPARLQNLNIYIILHRLPVRIVGYRSRSVLFRVENVTYYIKEDRAKQWLESKGWKKVN